jgi:phosphate transport system permease protein
METATTNVIAAVKQFIDQSRLALALKNNLDDNPDLAGTVDDVWAPTTMEANRQLHNVDNELTDEQRALLQDAVFFHLGTFYPDSMRKRYNAQLYGEGEKQETWLVAAATVDQYLKGKHSQISKEQIAEIEALREQGRIQSVFNAAFFTEGNSRKPEAAGIWAAVVGSVYLLLIVLACAFPVGVLTAIYLEEYAPDNRFTQIIEVNINNLAAIPSILYGLLGLAVFINLMGIERGAPLAGGLTLALRTLPIIIISTRAALRAVPGSIRLAAHSIGATRWQTILHHLLPLSVPGILTGTIIGLAQAIGETAPLIIIGMVAFRSSAPEGINAPSTALPAQIFRWFTNAQAGFGEKAAAGIMVLLVVLLSMNAMAIFLRAKFEKKW